MSGHAQVSGECEHECDKSFLCWSCFVIVHVGLILGKVHLGKAQRRWRSSVPLLLPVIADWPGSIKAPKPAYQENLKTQPTSARADAG